MKNILLLLTFSLCLGACSSSKSAERKKAASLNSSSAKPVKSDQAPPLSLPDEVLEKRTEWIKAFNQKQEDELNAFYWEKAGLFLIRELLQDQEEMADELLKLRVTIGQLEKDSIHSVVKHSEDRYFEMGRFDLLSDLTYPYAYITAWRKEGDTWLRELDVFDHAGPIEVDLEEIDRARKLWEERSNAQQHEVLVAESYATDGYYFNNGQVSKGTEAISDRYRYMSSPNWQITLRPIFVLPVSRDLVYELGQYRSGGVGHYVIIWEKEQDGIWKVRLDFNF